MVTSTVSMVTPTTYTSLLTVLTTDNSSISFYDVLIAALLVLFGASVFLLLLSAAKARRPLKSYSATGHYCRNCGTYLKQSDPFCGKCGTPQTP